MDSHISMHENMIRSMYSRSGIGRAYNEKAFALADWVQDIFLAKKCYGIASNTIYDTFTYI